MKFLNMDPCVLKQSLDDFKHVSDYSVVMRRDGNEYITDEGFLLLETCNETVAVPPKFFNENEITIPWGGDFPVVNDEDDNDEHLTWCKSINGNEIIEFMHEQN